MGIAEGYSKNKERCKEVMKRQFDIDSEYNSIDHSEPFVNPNRLRGLNTYRQSGNVNATEQTPRPQDSRQRKERKHMTGHTARALKSEICL